MQSMASLTVHHAPLEAVRHRVVAGRPLPFNVYRPDATLLLARGQVVQTEEQLGALLERGSLVDLREVQPPCDVDSVVHAPRAELPRLWRDALNHAAEVLRRPGHESFREALDTAARPLDALIARDPDLAIFQVLRQEGQPHARYGLTHSVHAGIVARLVATRLGWPEADTQRAFKAALTMNLSIVELQGQLAGQLEPPDAVQRALLHEHPRRSRALLEQSGVGDPVWLLAVEQHHEERGGAGYPAGLEQPSELATLLLRADTYSAKLSSRIGREAQAADRAGREIFMQDPGHPISAALVKEFGVYPPGCFVAMASGETGVVVKRGATVMTPIVAALTNAYGTPLADPVRRDTQLPLHAVVGVLGPRQMRAEVSLDKLMTLPA